MAKHRSILLGDYFDKFLNSQVQSGRFSSTSEVICAALRLFEQEEMKKKQLINELKTGEKSGMNENFDKKQFTKRLHEKYLDNDL